MTHPSRITHHPSRITHYVSQVPEMWILVYIYIFSFSLALSAILVPVARKIAIRFSILDQPEARKSHLKPVPLLGGIAIYTSFVLTVVINLGILSFLKANPELLAFLPDIITEKVATVEVTYGRLLGILLGGTFIMILGLIDDIKGSYQNNIDYLPEAILERDKERRVKHSQSATQAMSDAVVAQKRPGPLGSPIFEALRRCYSVMCRRGHIALVAPCTDLKSGTPNGQGYSDTTPKGLSPKIKLSGQFFAALLLILFGVRLTLFLPTYPAILITIFWVVGITNAFNLLDNMDGLSSGVALIASLIFLVVALLGGQFLVSVILIAFIGTTLGFLRHNFHPATIFMGDAGSMLIGFLLASLTILSTFYAEGAPTHLPVVMPLLILGVPLFDTASVILIRLKKKLPIFKADKRHLSHRLTNLGMTKKQAVLFIYLLTFCVGIGALLLRDVGWGGALIILLQMLSVFGLIILLEVVKARRKDIL